MSAHTYSYNDFQGSLDLPARAQAVGLSKLWFAPNHPLVPSPSRGKGQVYVAVWGLHKKFMAGVASRAERFQAPDWRTELGRIGAYFFFTA